LKRQSGVIVLFAGTWMAFGQVPAAWGFDIPRAKTEVAVVDPSSEAPALQLDFKAELDRVPALARADVVATWEQAGGVEPTPFLVTIPAECWVPNRAGFHVEDFRACGVSVELDRRLVPLMDFEARLLTRGDGTALLDLGALFGGTPDDSAPELLGALGGAVVELAIGAESSAAPPLSVETVGSTTPDDG